MIIYMNDTNSASVRLDGHLDRATAEWIGGWAWDPTAPDRAQELELLLDGISVGRFRADRLRPDLLEGGIGTGLYGFDLRVPEGLSRGQDREIRVLDPSGADLPGSPILVAAHAQAVPAEELLDHAVRHAVAMGGAEQAALLKLLSDHLAVLLPAPPPPQAALLHRLGHARDQRQPRPRALVINEGLPDTSRDAGSNAMLSHLRALQRLGFAVEFAPAWSMRPPAGLAAALEALGIAVWREPWAASVEEALQRGGDDLDIVYLHRFAVMARYAPLARRWCANARVVYSLADLHWLRAARAAGAVNGEPLPPSVAALQAAELQATHAADVVLTHSSHEQALLQVMAPGVPVHVTTWDTTASATAVPFEQRAGVAFLGGFGHPPNLDAALYLLDDIMPLVWAQAPDIPCLLAGSEMPDILRDRAGPRVEVVGHVPDLAALWDRVRISVAPLRFGAGLKGKVLESLAAGIPCICTPVAAEGFAFTPPLDQLLAASTAEIAAAILRLHGDAGRNAVLAAAGRDLVARDFSTAALDDALRVALGL